LTDTIAVALVSAGGSVAVAITALLLNFRLFNSLERRIEVIETDLKTFFRMHAEFEKRISKLEDKGK
jgi:biopolymer transport protein ExbB/TolQ